MIDPDLVFRIANIFFLIGTIILIYSIIKNRNVLKGFQPVGSFLSLIAISWVQFNYFQMNYWENFWLSLPTWGLWLLATVFSIKNTIKGWLEYRKGELSVFRSLGYRNKKDWIKRGKKCGDCFYFSRIKVKHCNFDGKEISEFSPACKYFKEIYEDWRAFDTHFKRQKKKGWNKR